MIFKFISLGLDIIAIKDNLVSMGFIVVKVFIVDLHYSE
jgi:hypothetical protein